MVDIQLVHRMAMFLAVAAIAALVVLLERQRMELPALAIGLALAIQVWLGAMNVWVGKSAALVVAHLTVGTLLWVLVAAVLLLTGAPAPGVGRRGRGLR
jgi:heme A synthase